MIFPAIWALLPGPRIVRMAVLAVILVVAVWSCFVFVFPWLSEEVLPQPDAEMEYRTQNAE
jgi:hypothetical protein